MNMPKEIDLISRDDLLTLISSLPPARRLTPDEVCNIIYGIPRAAVARFRCEVEIMEAVICQS